MRVLCFAALSYSNVSSAFAVADSDADLLHFGAAVRILDLKRHDIHADEVSL